ncbi:MAG TPA: cytochrome b/b6 domain-containing protein [Coriobacteriia bacterium]
MSLTTINVWLDVVFTSLYVVIIAFLVFHFSLFVYFGRFKKSFVEGVWPEHDSRPPATPKVLHFVHMSSMLILGFSGMYLRFPFFAGGRTFMRDTHYVFMVIVIAILIWRVWYAFFSRTNADWREFAIGKKDVQSALGVLAYYGYFSNKKPHVAKYNVLQKMSYNMFLYMMILQAFTGLALLKFNVPMVNVSMSQLIIGWNLGALVGSAALALWIVRMVHYVLNWAFILMTTIHLYLAATADVPCALDFFGMEELEVHPGGHGHDEIPAAAMSAAATTAAATTAATTAAATPEFEPTS